MAEAIYVLCAATSLVAAWLLLRTYLSRRTALLLWSSIAFVGLAANNIILVGDLVLFKAINLSAPRTITGMVAMLVLLVGLIWEAER